MLALVTVGMVAVSACDHQSCLRCGENGACELCNATLFYFPDGKGQCLVQYSQLCELKEDDGTCHKCSQGLFPYKGLCRARETGDVCIRRDCDAKCVRCASGNILDDGECAPDENDQLPENCSFGDAQFNCLECSFNYFLYQNKCYKNPNNCIAPSICSSCAKNSFLVPETGVQIRKNFWHDWVSLKLTGVFHVAKSTCADNIDPGCLEAISVDKCGRCKDGFAIDAQRKCVDPTDQLKCVALDASDKCISCVEGFYLDNGNCIQSSTVDPNCRYYNSPTLCERCYAHYYLVSTTDRSKNKCVDLLTGKKDDNCDYYDTSSTCQYCVYPFKQVGGACKPLNALVTNCVVYKQTGCVQCTGDTYLKSGKCESVDTLKKTGGCVRYNSSQACVECQTTFFLSGGKCYSRAIQNCESYTSQGVCKYCKPLFYLSNGICNLTGPRGNCRIYTSISCAACSRGYDLVSGSCTRSVINLCARYKDARQCEYCINNYYYDETLNRCVLNPIGYEKCTRLKKISATKFECILCERPNVRDTTNGTCISAIDDDLEEQECVNFTSDLKCERCKYGYSLSSTDRDCTQMDQQVVTKDNCLHYTNFKCVECVPTFYLDKYSKCQPIIPVVSFCSDYISGKCNQCLDGYYLVTTTSSTDKRLLESTSFEGRKLETVTTHSCKSITKVTDCARYTSTGCEYCGSGKLLISGVCKDITDIRNCAEYTGAITCNECLNGYLKNNACTDSTSVNDCARYSKAASAIIEVCAECAATHYLYNNKCIPLNTVPDCRYVKDEYNCAVCKDNALLDLNNQCVAGSLIDNCEEAKRASGCYLCKSNFYFNSPNCSPISTTVTNCLELASSSNCKRCYKRYYLKDGLCTYSVNEVKNCSVYSGDGVCSKCDDNFAVINSGANCLANCLNADAAGKCLKCAAGKIWNGTACSDAVAPQKVDNCLFYNTDAPNLCNQCNAGFWLQNNQCLDAGIPTCAIVDPSKPSCAYCDTTFVADGAGKCTGPVQAIAGCNFYAQATAGKCDVCQDTFHDVADHSQCAANGVAVSDFETQIASWKTV